jgi:hypothetical protein
MATTTPQQNKYKNTLFDITELLYLIFCFTAYTATIVLRKKFLDPSRLHQDYHSSRTACLSAAVSILDLQCLVDEETQADGLLYQSRWRVSSAISNDFLLATSILCYCVQTQQKQPSTTSKPVGIEPSQLDKIRMLLEAPKNIWSRQTTHSKEAQKAVAAIQYVLGNSGVDVRNSAAEQVFQLPEQMLRFLTSLVRRICLVEN